MAQAPHCPHCQSALSASSLVGDLPQYPTSTPLDLLDSDRLLHGTISQSSIEAIEQRLAALNGLLNFTKELGDSISEARRHAKLHLAKLKEGRNFSRGLPLELLRTVFLLIPVPRYPQFDWREDRTVIRIASVCRTWRSVALGCLELWAKFLVTSNSREEQIQLFLSRSQDHPLTLSWRSKELLPGGQNPGWKTNKRLLAIILPHSPRWRHVYFEDLPSDLLPIVYPLQNVPSLESLAITSSREAPPNFVSEAAHLNSLQLNGDFVGTLHPTSFPWIQIQSLHLYYNELNLRPVMSILPHLTNIVSLEISSGYIEDEITPYESTTLPFLRTLALGGNWYLLLAKLSTPVIQKLEISSYEHGPSAWPELGIFISDHLSLQDIDVLGRGYNFCPPKPCSLRRLSVLLPSANHDNLQLFSCRYLQQHFPALEELKIIISCEDGMDDEVEDMKTATIIRIVEDIFYLCQERDRISTNDIPSQFLRKVVADLWEDPEDEALDTWAYIGSRTKELQNVRLQMQALDF
ncbi:hypothetical protein DL96DRAFT_1606577 [Flagelloscypha sp. PMI_526]|nr:hypothetical protein DL96DRAFT_1606577 [Flagelloscypha sp. PMI_526]